MANPILRPGVIFASYSDIYHLNLPYDNVRDLRSSYTMPNKDVEHPTDLEYESWLLSDNAKQDVLTRRALILETGRSDPETFSVPKTSTEKKKEIKKSMKKGTIQLTNKTKKATSDDEAENDVFSDEEEPPIVASAPQNSQQAVDDTFNALLSISWRDKDEYKMNDKVLNRVSLNTLIRIFPTMKKLADDLFLAVHEKTGALDDYDVEEKYNFLFHVIAKGESMYYQSIADPDFCIYLLDNWQPLYTMMKKKLNIRTD